MFIKQFSSFYEEILTLWNKNTYFSFSIPLTTTSQFLWFNKYTKVDVKCIYFRDVLKKGLNFVGQLFDLEEKMKE